MQLTRAEIREWLTNETTNKVLTVFSEEIDNQLAILAGGGIIGTTTDETAQQVNRVIGRVDGLKFIFGLAEELPDYDEE